MTYKDRIHIVLKNIVDFEGDAIVNAANNALMAGAGVCGAIFAAAGKYELSLECNKIGGCKTGEAVITNSYNLYPRIKRIIHTPGPHGDDFNKEQLLYNSYYNSLKVLVKNNLKTIAFPCISTGIFGFKFEDATVIAFKAVKDFLKTHQGVDVYFTFLPKETYRYNYYVNYLKEMSED